MKIEDIVKDETSKLVTQIEGQVTDPIEKAAIAQMTADLAMLPIRMSRGEDVSLLYKSLQAEALMRGVKVSMKAQAAVQQAWINIIFRVISLALTA